MVEPLGIWSIPASDKWAGPLKIVVRPLITPERQTNTT
jgi:hypothetical protein